MLDDNKKINLKLKKINNLVSQYKKNLEFHSSFATVKCKCLLINVNNNNNNNNNNYIYGASSWNF
jgi:hypothetical protein